MLLDYFYRFVTPWAKANKIQIFKNRIIGRIANYIYPIYCKVKPINNLNSNHHNLIDTDVTISLTSFPARIEKLYLCINTLLRQDIRADHVILWLADSQFNNKDQLPSKLLELETKGLKIRFCKDIRSYKKIIYTAKEYSDSIIVTADDDTLYPEYWLKELLNTHLQYPDCVCCYRSHQIIVNNHSLVPYKNWNSLSPDLKGPSYDLTAIGVGGVLYPKGFFNNVVLNENEIYKVCPTADDLWLKIVGLINQYKTVKVDPNSKEWFTIVSSQKETLTKTNVGQNVNDEMLRRLEDYYHFDIASFINEELSNETED